jgi:hypothetical protein
MQRQASQRRAMRHRRLAAALVMPVLLCAAIIGTSPLAARAQEVSPAKTAISESTTGEGCRLRAYTGSTPLEKLPYYFKGEEDLRGGMTCQFRIHPDLPVFIFHFPGQPDNTFGDIEISEATSGKEIQTIENSTEPGVVEPSAVKDVLQVVDANFDGYKDLQILIQCGGTGNCSYNFYLYDPKAGQFVLDKFLSDLSTPSFDAAKKQVTSSSNSSYADWQSATYQYKDGQYTLIHREVSEWDRVKKSVTVSTYELRGGKMQLVNSETTPE